LKDDLELADAIDCMVSYFYNAPYDASQYDTPRLLLHAQVATITDKYICESLYKLATTSFAELINTAESKEWVNVAAFVYNHTTTDSPAHEELRRVVIAAIVDRPLVFDATIRLDSTAQLLRSDADPATDLLLAGLNPIKGLRAANEVFACDHCHYAHVGSCDCAFVTSQSRVFGYKVCPQCERSTALPESKKRRLVVQTLQAFSCSACNGFHTIGPVEDFVAT
jgi:hypothetical protein